MNTFGFRNCWTSQRVILGCSMTFSKRMLDDFIDHDPIFRVHAYQSATFTRSGHSTKDCRIVNQEDAGIGHEHLEARHAFIHRGVQLLNLAVFQFGCDQMKAIVDGCFAFSFLMPVVDPLDRKSTRLNSSHITISYAVFCLKKKKTNKIKKKNNKKKKKKKKKK